MNQNCFSGEKQSVLLESESGEELEVESEIDDLSTALETTPANLLMQHHGNRLNMAPSSGLQSSARNS